MAHKYAIGTSINYTKGTVSSTGTIKTQLKDGSYGVQPNGGTGTVVVLEDQITGTA